MNGKRDATSSDSPLVGRAIEEKNRQQLLDVLGDPIRRQVLHDLDPEEDPVALSDLAERVANPHVRDASDVAWQSSDDATSASPDATPADRPSASADRPSADRPSANATPTDRVALQLHHVHLPKLADYGLVEYDHREKTVTAKSHS